MDTEEASPPFSLNMRVVIPDRQRLPIWGCYTASLWVVPEKASQSLSRKSSSSPPGRPLRILSLSSLSVAHLGMGFSQLSNCYLSSTSWIKYNSLVWWENFFLSFKTCFSQYHIIILVEFYPSLIPSFRLSQSVLSEFWDLSMIISIQFQIQVIFVSIAWLIWGTNYLTSWHFKPFNKLWEKSHLQCLLA